MKIPKFLNNMLWHISKFIERILLKIPVYRKHLIKLETERVKRHTRAVEDDILNAARLLKQLNAKMKAAGWSRRRRKQFWYDFIKHDLFREDIFDQLVKGRESKEGKDGR